MTQSMSGFAIGDKVFWRHETAVFIITKFDTSQPGRFIWIRRAVDSEAKPIRARISNITLCVHEPVSAVDHPAHYGGEDNAYEAIKVIEAWQLGFNLGNVVKYISRAPHKANALEDLQKAAWYLAREINSMKDADA